MGRREDKTAEAEPSVAVYDVGVVWAPPAGLAAAATPRPWVAAGSCCWTLA